MKADDGEERFSSTSLPCRWWAQGDPGRGIWNLIPMALKRWMDSEPSEIFPMSVRSHLN